MQKGVYMKKKLVAMAACAAMFVLAGCQSKAGVQVFAPEGAASLAIASHIDANFKADGLTTDFTIVSPSNISTKLITHEADMAVLPINAAAKLYNSMGEGADRYQAVTVVTYGNLYFVGDSPLGDEATTDDDLEALKGNVTGVIGQGNVPDLVFRMMLNASNIAYETGETAKADSVVIRYYGSGNEVIAALRAGVIDIGLFAEPAVSKACAALQMENIGNVQMIWQDIFHEPGFPQACLVVKESFYEAHSKYVEEFVQALNPSFAIDNPERAQAAVESKLESGVTSSLTGLTSEVASACNIVALNAYDKAAIINEFFAGLVALNTDTVTVLDEVPNAAFYLN